MKKLKPSTIKAWSFFTAGIFAIIAVVGCDSKAAKTVTNYVTNNVSTIVTNEIIKEVPKEVEKIVNVPAEIPPEYIVAKNLYDKMTNVTVVNLDQVLFNMKDVRVHCSLDNAVQQVISEDEVKAKFELALRRNNVPINPNSPNAVNFSIEGFFDVTTGALLCYSINTSVYENQWVFRNGNCRMAPVIIWTKGNSYGTVGKSKANEALLNEVEKRAEIFANDFLSANPKQ